MRLKNHEIHGRINGNLEIEFTRERLTSFSGLELFNRYFRAIGLRGRVAALFKSAGIGGDYKVPELILTFITLWLSGGNRLRHIRYLAEDVLVKRVIGVKKVATERTLSRWLKRFTPASLEILHQLNAFLVLGSLVSLRLKRITLDFDGTVLSTGDDVELAVRGYNPHKRFSKSYYPFLCHVAQTGHFLRVKNRRGNMPDSRGGALRMIADCIRQVREALGSSTAVEIRLDSAFFSEQILRFLSKVKVIYAVKMPIWHWTGARELINERTRWIRVSDDLHYFRSILPLRKWNMNVSVIVFRKCLTRSNLKPKTFQLDLFDPGDGIYEYQIIATNQELSAENALEFYNGRCAMEREISELKREYGFASIPTKSFHANSAYQALSILTHSLVKNFQLAAGEAIPRKKTRNRTGVYYFESLKTLRFKIISRAGRMVNKSGKSVLKMVHEPGVTEKYDKITRSLERIAA